jgi:hypothetical protein
MRTRVALASFLVAALGLAPACGGSDVTAARVVVTLQAGVEADQLRLLVLVAGVPLTAADVPRVPAGAIASGTDLVVRFPDALANQQVTFLVASLRLTAQTGRGEGSTTLKMAQTVLVEVTVDAAACPANQHTCTSLCVPDAELAHCGLACVTCPTPAGHGAAACEGGMCTIKCDAGYDLCDNQCVNLTQDPDHCGQCGEACSASQVCSDSACVPNPCAAGKHLCGTECVTDADVAHCGRGCEPCPQPSNGTATCDGTECGASCQSGYHACGSQCLSDTSPASCGTRCTACPLPPSGHGLPACQAGACTVTCDGSHHACDGDCVTDNDPAHCGTRCAPCPTPTNGSATCSGGACGVMCNSGYKPCQGACVPSNQSCQATWSLRSGSGPAGRTRPGLAYDAGRGVTILFGGWDGIQSLADTWTWNGTTWTQRTPATSPSPRSAVAMAYDATRDRVVLFGGEETEAATMLGDTWTWNGTTWSNSGQAGPEARSFASAVWDGGFEQVVLFGGWDGFAALDDLWAWDGTEWMIGAPANGPPGARANFGMIYDSGHGGGQVVVFGGSTDNVGNGLYGDTWLLLADTWDTPALATAPASRAGFGFAYDSARNLGVLFGGLGGSSTYLGDTWAWNGGWATLATTGSPTARWRGGMVFDSGRGVTVYFGGAAPPNTYFGETWELAW